MKWIIAPHTRADLHAFTGVNLSGQRYVAQIFAAGGRQGDEFEGDRIRSAIMAGPPGTRFVFSTTVADEGWEERPWRAVVILPGHAFKAQGGMLAVRIPDLDFLDDPNARRNDPDFQCSYDVAKTLADASGWTYGNPGPIKNSIRTIRIDRVDVGE